MFTIEKYLINENTISITGLFDRYGKKCSLIKELTRSFIVDCSPQEVIEFSIECIGYNLKGALETAKKITGQTHMRPVIINPVIGIVMFTTKSMDKHDTLWLNPKHIVRTGSANRKTYVFLSNGQMIIVEGTLPAFSTKITKAEQLLRIVLEKAHNPSAYSVVTEKNEQSSKSFTIVLDPSKRKKTSNSQDE